MKRNITIYLHNGLSLRERFVLRLLEKGSAAHTRLYTRRTAWDLNSSSLLAYASDSLGHQLGLFYRAQRFEPIPRAEHHDVFHVLLGYNTAVKEETEMQFLLMGNGKRSPFTLSTCLLSLLLFPGYWKCYRVAFAKGKAMPRFYNWNFKHLLKANFAELRRKIHYSEITNPLPASL